MARIRLVEHAPGAPGLRWFGIGPDLRPTRGLLKLRRLFHKHAFWAETRTDHDLCLLYTSPSPRDRQKTRMPSSA